MDKLNFLKEIGRVVLLAVVSYLSTEVVVGQVLDIAFGIRLDPATKIVITGLLLSVLKALDRELHNSGIAEKGLTRF